VSNLREKGRTGEVRQGGKRQEFSIKQKREKKEGPNRLNIWGKKKTAKIGKGGRKKSREKKKTSPEMIGGERILSQIKKNRRTLRPSQRKGRKYRRLPGRRERS